MKCPKCKHVIPDDSLFCPDCGCKIDNKEERIKELKCEAKAAYDAEDFGKSFGAYQEAANLGDAEAQYMLAMQYEGGDGTIQDGAACHKWLLKAAQNGHVEAQFLVAEQYYYGEQIKKDKKTAAVWYQKAANAKHPDAMFKLGYCYEMGEGVPQNESLAQEYFVQAEKLGSKMYADYLDEKEEEDRRQERIRKEKEEEERRTAEEQALKNRAEQIAREALYGGYHLIYVCIITIILIASSYGFYLTVRDYHNDPMKFTFVLLLGLFFYWFVRKLFGPLCSSCNIKKWMRNHPDDPVCKYLQEYLN